jgi:hypothetical protein
MQELNVSEEKPHPAENKRPALYKYTYIIKKNIEAVLPVKLWAGEILQGTVGIAGQKIVKALTFNGQHIVGLCKSLMLNTVNF